MKRHVCSPTIVAAMLLYLMMLGLVLISSIGILSTDFTNIRWLHFVQVAGEVK